MKLALIARATLYTVQGGDTIQIINTAKHLIQFGIDADIKTTNEPIDYNKYDLLHFFNIIRPADILFHLNKTNKPFVVSPILVDYSEYDKYHRKGIAGNIFRYLSFNSIEYLKTLGRWLKGNDELMHTSYLWKGHKKCVKEILMRAAMVLPNSLLEYRNLVDLYKVEPDYRVVYNGVDAELFKDDNSIEKDAHLVLCVARIEGIKNQLNVIKALNNTAFKLFIIGSAAPNQINYFNKCRKFAGSNIVFKGNISQKELIHYYRQAKIHILPSWFETCGLSTLEAGAMGCNVVISNKGYVREYYEDYPVYCDPASPASIYEAVQLASNKKFDENFRKKITTHYTWLKAAEKTAAAYKHVIDKA